MNQQTIIELRESDAHINNLPGDYQVALKDPIALYPGDQLEIKSAYIDSVEASSGDIVIDEDVEPSISFASYVTDWSAPGRPTPGYVSANGVIHPDLRPYFACTKASASDMTKTYAIEEIRVYKNKFTPNGTNWGRDPNGPAPTFLDIVFQYTDNNGQKIQKSLPLKYISDGVTDVQIFNFQSHPTLFPFFVKGTIANVSTEVTPTQQTLDNIRTSDNINKDALVFGNLPDPSGQNAPTFFNMYDKFLRTVSWKFFRAETSGGNIGPLNADKAITIQYKDWADGQTKTAKITFPEAENADTLTHIIDPALNIVGGSQTINRPETDSLGNVKYLGPFPFPGSEGSSVLNSAPPNIATKDSDADSNFFMENLTTQSVDIGLVARIKIFTESTKIPAGKYPAAELCERLTDGFTALIPDNTSEVITSFPTNNNFLKTNNQIRVANGITDPSERQYYVRDDGESLLFWTKQPDTTDPFVGTDQVAFVSDSNINKVKIQAIHTPIYDDSNLTPIIKYADAGNSTSRIIGRNSGVVFTDMNPKGFWDKLGFSTDPDLAIYNVPTDRTTQLQSQDLITQSIKVDEGRFTTNALASLDAVIVKANPYIFTGLASLNSGAGSAVTATKEIVATNSIAQSSDSTGYFLIEISGIPKSDVVGAKLATNKISSIVSRYYQSGNYTTSYNEGSIATVYQGEPTVLSNFRVRVLNGDGNLSPDVNSKSCIFLELTRAPPQKK